MDPKKKPLCFFHYGCDFLTIFLYFSPFLLISPVIYVTPLSYLAFFKIIFCAYFYYCVKLVIYFSLYII